MDDLQDAIQDAQYIGAMVDPTPRPSRKMDLISDSAAKVFGEQLTLLKPMVVQLESFLSEPLGFYMFSRYMEEVGDSHCLEFLQEAEAFAAIQLADKRLMKAMDIRARFLRPVPTPAPEDGANVSLPSGSTTPFPYLLRSVARRKRYGVAASARKLYQTYKSLSSRLGVDGPIVERLNSAIDEISRVRGIVPPRGERGVLEDTVAAAESALEPSPSDAESLTPTDIVCTSGPPASGSSSGAGLRKPAPITTDDEVNPGAGAGAGAGSTSPVSPPGTLRSSVSSHSFTEPTTASFVGLQRDFYFRLSDAVLAGIIDRHEERFKTSPHFLQLLKFKHLETKVVKESDFNFLRILGRGGFGAVKACKKADTGKLYAIKTMNKRRIKKKNAVELVWNERQILAKVSSPFVGSLKYALQTPSDLHLVLDIMTGGDLAFHLAKSGRFEEERAKFYAAEILLGLEHLHSMNIVYRDLKPENILLNDQGHCSISDMGLATRARKNLTGRCGTRGYWAPEMLKKIDGHRVPYTFTVDWWSFGCLVYEFVCGKCPFRTEKAKSYDVDKHKSIDMATQEMEPDFSSPVFSIPLISLLTGLLCKDPAKRLGARGAAEIKANKWFEGFDWGMLASGQLKAPFIPETNINAASQDAIGAFEDSSDALTPEDQEIFRGWSYVGKQALQEEIVEFLKWEAEKGPLVGRTDSCCVIL